MDKKDSTGISKGLSTLSDLLGKIYQINRDLMEEKDGLMSMQQKYIEKCQEFIEKQELFNDLKKRMAQLQDEHNLEMNFIMLTEEDVFEVEGTIFISQNWFQSLLNKNVCIFSDEEVTSKEVQLNPTIESESDDAVNGTLILDLHDTKFIFISYDNFWLSDEQMASEQLDLSESPANEYDTAEEGTNHSFYIII